MKVRFCVGPRGEPTGVGVEESSGQALLDEAAEDCVVKGAGPFPATRDCLKVPVDFSRPGAR